MLHACHIHWPPLFPEIWLPPCQLMQLDVSIWGQVRIFWKYLLTNIPDYFFFYSFLPSYHQYSTTVVRTMMMSPMMATMTTISKMIKNHLMVMMIMIIIMTPSMTSKTWKKSKAPSIVSTRSTSTGSSLTILTQTRTVQNVNILNKFFFFLFNSLFHIV